MLKKNKLINVILAFALSAAVAVSFAGCESNNASTSSDSSSETTQSSQTAEETDSEQAAENSNATSSEAENGANSSAYTEGTTVGEGETEFAFEVVLEDGSTTLYHVMTDQTTVGAALLELGLIEGDEGEYGLYVKTVNGVTADYDTDGKYWAFYIDGEYASTSVDATEIVNGSSYAFKIEA